MRRCASSMSVITSGSGPSSRTDPASTISTPCSIADFITQSFSPPATTPPDYLAGRITRASLYSIESSFAEHPKEMLMPSAVLNRADSTS